MKTNDLKKGTRIRLRNGFYATLMDSKKGNTRLADVEGIYREIGSVYSHDIVSAKSLAHDGWLPVEYTPAQQALRETIAGVFGG